MGSVSGLGGLDLGLGLDKCINAETKLCEATQNATDERMTEVESHIDEINSRLNLRFVTLRYSVQYSIKPF